MANHHLSLQAHHYLFAGGSSYLQFIKNAVSVKHNKKKHHKMSYIIQFY